MCHDVLKVVYVVEKVSKLRKGFVMSNPKSEVFLGYNGNVAPEDTTSVMGSLVDEISRGGEPDQELLEEAPEQTSDRLRDSLGG